MCQNIFEEFKEIRDNFDIDMKLSEKLKVTKKLDFNLESELQLIRKNM